MRWQSCEVRIRQEHASHQYNPHYDSGCLTRISQTLRSAVPVTSRKGALCGAYAMRREVTGATGVKIIVVQLTEFYLR